MSGVFDVEYAFDCIASYLDIQGLLSLSRACKRTRDLVFDRALGDHTYAKLDDCTWRELRNEVLTKEDIENTRSATIKGRFPWSCFWEVKSLWPTSSPPKVFGMRRSAGFNSIPNEYHLDPFKQNRRNPGWCKAVNIIIQDPAAFERVIGVFSRHVKDISIELYNNGSHDFLATLKHVTKLDIEGNDSNTWNNARREGQRTTISLRDPILSTMCGVSVLKIGRVRVEPSFIRNLPRNLRELYLFDLNYETLCPLKFWADTYLDLCHLPALLESLSVEDCRLSTDSLRLLPANLKTLHVACISIDEHTTTHADIFDNLPGSLRSLHFRSLPSSTRLDHLPPGLKELTIKDQYCHFPPDFFCRLPRGLVSFGVELGFPSFEDDSTTNLLDYLALPPNLEMLQVFVLFWPNFDGGTKRVNVPNPPKTLKSIAVHGYAPILLQVGNTTVECATDSNVRRTATWKKSGDRPVQKTKNDAKE